MQSKIFALPSAQERFRAIYKNRYWLAAESASGTGSSMAATEQIRSWLPKLLKERRVGTFLDAPCGDWNWMRVIAEEIRDVNYIGGDIVPELIETNKARYERPGVSFRLIDITSDPLPPSDLMMVRDCLFHLSFTDIKAFLANFVRSEIPYLLTSTHIDANLAGNRDILSGDFRLIDLSQEPFGFDARAGQRFPDTTLGEPAREMWLLSRAQIVELLKAKGP